MGLCFSSTSTNPHTAKVVDADGFLREYSTFVTVSDVLGSHFPFNFLCNADSLTYNAHIPVLHLDATLQLGQLYFILPVEILKTLLTGQDMAVLAAKAMTALKSASGKDCYRRRRNYKVVPIPTEAEEVEEDNQELARVLFRQRSSQKRVRVRTACVSSMVKLSTIEEVAE